MKPTKIYALLESEKLSPMEILLPILNVSRRYEGKFLNEGIIV